MEILGKHISDQTAQLISQLEEKLAVPVTYQFTDTDRTTDFGLCRLTEEGCCIYSKESLFTLTKAKAVNTAFETNLLHQLLRGVQQVEGYPFPQVKDTEITRSSPDFYEQLGWLYAASVLNLNVDARLKELGYDSAYFYRHAMNQADKMVRKGCKFNNEVDFTRYVCQLMLLKLACPGEEMNRLMGLYREKNAGLVVFANRLAEEIGKQGYATPEETFGALAILFCEFNLWFTHDLVFQGKRYADAEAVRKDFPQLVLPDRE